MFSELALYKTLSGIAIAASILPILWHIKTKNIASISLVLWIGIFNTISFINAFIWGGDIFTAWEGRVFCDIEIKFLIGAITGQMGACAAATRNLANIMRDDLPVMKTRTEKRRQMIVDLLLCYGIPTWMIGIHYIVQPDRYWLVQVIGCTPTVDNSWPSIVLVFIWPPIMALVAMYFCILVCIRLYRYRHEFEKIISSSSSNTTKSRFLRLYIYCACLILVLLPATFYTLYRNLNVERLPYDWELVHDPVSWGTIYRIPTDGHVTYDKWIIIAAGILLFLFFGLGNDALCMYREWLEIMGLEKYWDRMEKRRNERKENSSNGWNSALTLATASGFGTGNSTKVVGKVTSKRIMNSVGSRDDISESTTLYIEDTNNNKQRQYNPAAASPGHLSPLYNPTGPSLSSINCNDISVSHYRHMTTSPPSPFSSTHSLPEPIHLRNNSPLLPAPIPISDRLSPTLTPMLVDNIKLSTRQNDSKRPETCSDSGNGNIQGNDSNVDGACLCMPCTRDDNHDHRMDCCGVEKGKGKKNTVNCLTDAAEPTSGIMVKTEVKVDNEIIN